MKTTQPSVQVPLFRVNERGEVVYTIEGLKLFEALHADLKDHEGRIEVLEP